MGKLGLFEENQNLKKIFTQWGLAKSFFNIKDFFFRKKKHESERSAMQSCKLEAHRSGTRVK